MTGCLRLIVLTRLLQKSRVLLGSRNGNRKPCRLWTGGQSKGGGRPSSGPYGSIWIPGIGSVRAHVAAAWIAGKIPSLRVPEGMNIDHTCERTLCIEDDHFELVPKQVNQERRWTRRRKVA